MIEVDQLRDMKDAADVLAAAGVDGLSGADLCSVVLGARRLRELADRLEVHALGALEESGYTDVEFGSLTPVWLASQCGLPSSVGRAQIRTARMLRRTLPGTDQAWLDGRLSRDQVQVLVRAANPRIRDVIAEIEPTLIDLAEGRTFVHWCQAVAAVVATVDEDGPEPDDPTNSTASWSRSGAFAELRARFGGASVEIIEQILDAKTNELFRRQAADREVAPELPELTRSQLRAQAIVELLLQAQGVDLASSRGPRTSVHLVVRADTLGPIAGQRPLGRSAAAAVGWTGTTDVLWSLSGAHGDHLLAGPFASMLCDADIQRLVVDADGTPLELGTTARYATPTQRKIVIERDGGCIHPGCDCPVTWIEIHHVIRHADGGQTVIINLVALCKRHHGLAHRKGWTLSISTDGWPYFTTPTGRTYWGQRHGKQPEGPAPPPHTKAA